MVTSAMNRTVCGFASGMALGIGALPVWSQASSSSRSLLKGAAVEYLYPEQVMVSAGKPIEGALDFRIAEGLHINSHTPEDECLSPPSLGIPDGEGGRLETATYPNGTEFTLPADPATKLNVYT